MREPILSPGRHCTIFTAALGSVLLGLAAAGPPATAQGVELWNQPCQKLLKQYAGKPPHKAFAVSYLASGSGSGQSCGASWGARSKAQAEAAAIKSCKSNVAGACGVMRSE